MIIGMLGGMIGPRAPAEATRPALVSLEYPAFTMDGSMMDPMAATVAGPEPVKAAKIAQLKTVTIPSPPGIQPRRLFAQSVSLREMPPKSI